MRLRMAWRATVERGHELCRGDGINPVRHGNDGGDPGGQQSRRYGGLQNLAYRTGLTGIHDDEGNLRIR